jgi:hypothetical protein
METLSCACAVGAVELYHVSRVLGTDMLSVRGIFDRKLMLFV